MSSSNTVLVTGAAGFIGSHLTEACLGRGWKVRALDCLTDYYDPEVKAANIDRYRNHPDCAVIAADLLTADLDEAVENVDIIFHLAAQPGVRGSWGSGFETYARQNLNAFQRLLEAATRHGVDRFVYASSSSVYGNAESYPTPEAVTLAPVSPYGMTKAAGEQLAGVYFRNHHLPVVGLRYFTVFGPRQRPDMAFNRLIGAALRHETFVVYGDGRQTRDFTYVRDAVAGTIAAGLHGASGSVYNIGGGGRISMLEVFDIVQDLTGAELKLSFSSRQQGDARDTSADVSRAAADLGYRPGTTVAEGLGLQLDWQRASGPRDTAIRTPAGRFSAQARV